MYAKLVFPAGTTTGAVNRTIAKLLSDSNSGIETMRITDPGESPDAQGLRPQGNIYDQIKAKSKVSESVDEDTGEVNKITADVQSNKLKQLLGQIKQS